MSQPTKTYHWRILIDSLTGRRILKVMVLPEKDFRDATPDEITLWEMLHGKLN